MNDRFEEDLARFKANPKGVRFQRLAQLCEYYFGPPRIRGSHHVYKTPWPSDPRVNIQDTGGEAKAYQVRQVIKAVEHLLKTKQGGPHGKAS